MTLEDFEDVVRAEALLRPSAAQLLTAWKTIVVEERLQVERLPNRPRPEDFYRPVAETFRGEPERPDDVVLQHLLTGAQSTDTWLDLGAGGGRYALPLARHIHRVIAVEPSEGMRQVLQDAMKQNGVQNIDILPERWPAPTAAGMADVGMIMQVGYDIADIGPFIDELEAHSRRFCIAGLLEHAPISEFASLWEPVHGVKRQLLPALREFVGLLLARGSMPEMHLLTLPPRTFRNIEALQGAARRPLWVLEGSAEDQRLRLALQRLAVPVTDGVALSANERRLGIVTWQPSGR